MALESSNVQCEFAKLRSHSLQSMIAPCQALAAFSQVKACAQFAPNAG
jgi:hypothetical protein